MSSRSTWRLMVLLGVCAACSDELQPLPSVPFDLGDGLSFPVSVEEQSLVDSEGRVLILNGDAPWSLAVQLDSAEVLEYLDVRARQGVNAILFNLIEHHFGDAAPANAYGFVPFSKTLDDGAPDMRSLNAHYWDFIEWIVAEAGFRGILCFVVPAYVGYAFNEQGWSREIEANGIGGLAAYGDSLSERLGSSENLVWVMGGDWGPVRQDIDLTSEIDALANAIDRALPNALLTAHPRRNHSALDSYDRPWLDFNTTYSEVTNGAARLEEDHSRTRGASGRTMPSIWLEGYYENEHDMSETMLRSQMYWSLLGGASGHFYGAFPVWSFGATSAEEFGDSDAPPYTSWRTALVSDVAEDLIHVRRLSEEVPLHDYRPDFEREFVVSPRGTEEDWIAAAVARDSSGAVVYTPRRARLRVDLSALVGPSVRARWIDPGTWSQWDAGVHPAAGLARFRPPSPGDWLLLLEASDETAPGS